MDAGNFAELEPPQPWEKTGYVFELMARQGYDAATPGDRELLRGLDSLRVLTARHPEVHMVSANLRDKSGTLVFPEYAVFERGGVRFGVTGVTGPSYYRRNLETRFQAMDDFDVEDSRSALRRVVPRLREEADVIVVLAHEPVDTVIALQQAIPGMDVLVAGHDPGVVPAPQETAPPLLVRPGNKGQFVYRVPVSLDPGTRDVLVLRGEAVELGPTVVREPVLDAEITAWELAFRTKYLGPAAAAAGH